MKQPPNQPMARIRRDPRDASLDYFISKSSAETLYQHGLLSINPDCSLAYGETVYAEIAGFEPLVQLALAGPFGWSQVEPSIE